MEYYFKRYGDLELHRRMIGDRWRTDAFARAIAEVVGEGDAVLDVGTGTGILAMLAAKAGARKVYAVDQAEIVQTAANLVRANGFAERISVLRGSAADLRLDEKVDVLVSEWLGHFGFVEGMLDDVLAARDHNMAPGGRMLPSAVTVFLAPIDDPVLYGHDGPGFWRTPVHGLDLSGLEALELKQGRTLQIRIEPAAILSPGEPVVSVELAGAEPGAPWRYGELEFETSRDGVVNGFAGWFVAQLSPSVILDTSPLQPETHWSHSYFAFPPRPVKKGERLKVQFALERDPEERRHLQLHVKVDGVEQRYLLE